MNNSKRKAIVQHKLEGLTYATQRWLKHLSFTFAEIANGSNSLFGFSSVHLFTVGQVSFSFLPIYCHKIAAELHSLR